MNAVPDKWPFDQGPRVACLTTKQVFKFNFPILSVTHFSEEEDWAFTCGTTAANEDAMLVAMEEAFERDPTIAEVADLPLGWRAKREYVGGPWSRYADSSA
jgi:hypothetical protein